MSCMLLNSVTFKFDIAFLQLQLAGHSIAVCHVPTNGDLEINLRKVLFALTWQASFWCWRLSVDLDGLISRRTQ
jgi:hypothetical protein